MNAVFDTLAYAKKLQAAGIPERIAEVHAEALADVVEEKLATKSDIKELKSEMVALEERLSHKIEKITYQLTIRLGSLLTAGIVLVGTLHKLFN